MKDFLKIIGGGLIVTIPFTILFWIWFPSILVARCFATTLVLIGTIFSIEKIFGGNETPH